MDGPLYHTAATVYLDPTVEVGLVASRLRAEPGLTYVQPRTQACAEFGLPPDRMGDLVVISDRHTVLRSAPGCHDVSGCYAAVRASAVQIAAARHSTKQEQPEHGRAPTAPCQAEQQVMRLRIGAGCKARMRTW